MSNLKISPEVLNLQKDLCRCCHSEGVYMSLFSSYYWLDDEETAYSVTLQECFGIDMVQVVGAVGNMLCGICDLCIKKLQDARQFKQQVLACEAKLSNLYRKSNPDPFVKVEPPDVEEKPSDDALNDETKNNLDRSESDDDSKKCRKNVKLPKNESMITRKPTLSESSILEKRLIAPRAKKKPAAPEKPLVKTENTVSTVKCKIEIDKDDEKSGQTELSRLWCKVLADDDDTAMSREESDVVVKKENDGNVRTEAPAEGDSDTEPGTSQDSEITINDHTSIMKIPRVAVKRQAERNICRQRRKRKSVDKTPAGKIADKNKSDKEKKTSVQATKKKSEQTKIATKSKGTKVTPQRRPPLVIGIDYELAGDLYQCCRCEQKYKCLKSMRTHVGSVHLNIPKYACTESNCSKTFQKFVAFKNHQLQEHSIDDRVKCKACDAMYFKEAYLRRHVDSFHMLGEKYKCDSCDYECYDKIMLHKHKFNHKTVKEYKCSFCGKAFMRRTTMLFHERIHTGDKRKVCKECGQAFVQKASLNYHMTKYHPGVPF